MSNYMKKEYTSPVVIKTVIAPQSTILAGSIGVADTPHNNGDALGKGNNGDYWDDDDSDQDGQDYGRINLWN